MLTGVEPGVSKELEKSGTLRVVRKEKVFTLNPILGDSVRAPHSEAQKRAEKLNGFRSKVPE